MQILPRVLVALITPFDAGGAVDDDAHRHNLEVLTELGVEGLVMGGSTGQGPYLLPGERNLLIAIGRKALGPDPFFLCGIQAESVDQATAQIGEAADGGADAVLVMTPTTLVRGNDDLVALFYRVLADGSPLPIFLYSVPATTGYQLPVEIAADLATHPNVAGMKDSGGDTERIPGLIGAAGFPVLAGSSRAVHESVANGAHGAITASANYAYQLVVEALHNRAAQQQLTRLAAAVERCGLAGTYAAAEATGLSAGTMRLPLEPLDEDDRAVVTALFA